MILDQKRNLAPQPFPTVKNVALHVQAQLLDTMRQALQHANDAAIGPNANELEFERFSESSATKRSRLRVLPTSGRLGRQCAIRSVEDWREV